MLEPTPPAKVIEADDWNWRWELVGNETPEERKALEAMLSSARQFVADMVEGASPRWLTLIGRSGAGKTHLAKRIAQFVGARGREIYDLYERPRKDAGLENYLSGFSYAQEGGLMVKWPRLMDEMRSGDFHRYGLTGTDWFKVVDDLGLDSFDATAEATMLARGKMASLCDRRLGRWTVITTNYTRRQLGDLFDRRIPSRMMREGNVIVDASVVRDFNVRREALAAA